MSIYAAALPGRCPAANVKMSTPSNLRMRFSNQMHCSHFLHSTHAVCVCVCDVVVAAAPAKQRVTCTLVALHTAHRTIVRSSTHIINALTVLHVSWPDGCLAFIISANGSACFPFRFARLPSCAQVNCKFGIIRDLSQFFFARSLADAHALTSNPIPF